jgi:hypothetical protein
MFRFTIRELFLLTVVGSGCPFGCSTRPDTGVFVTLTRFGVVQPDDSIVDTQRISRKLGTVYGWSLQVTPTSDVTRIKEVLTLPEGSKFGPRAKSEPGAIKIVEYSESEDGREQTEVFEVKTRRTFTVVDRYIVSADDPPGHGVLKLYVNGVLVKEIDFDVED